MRGKPFLPPFLTLKPLNTSRYFPKNKSQQTMDKSHCYNPFIYLQSDNDIQRLVTNLFKSTTPKGSQSNDPFWDTAASMLLLALVFYLHYEAPEEEQNFAMVMEMLRAGAIEDEEDTQPSVLDILFSELEMENPDHIALKYYRSYHAGAAKTLKSIYDKKRGADGPFKYLEGNEKTV